MTRITILSAAALALAGLALPTTALAGDAADVSAVIVATQAPPFGLRKFSATLARALELAPGVFASLRGSAGAHSKPALSASGDDPAHRTANLQGFQD